MRAFEEQSTGDCADKYSPNVKINSIVPKSASSQCTIIEQLAMRD